MAEISKLVRDYAKNIVDGCYDEDETPPPLLELCLKCDTFDAKYLGALLLIENDRLADRPYKYGGDMFDPDLAEIAAEITDIYRLEEPWE